MKQEKSKCCNALVKIGGQPDFPKDKKAITQYYVCQDCGEACDLKQDNKNIEDIKEEFITKSKRELNWLFNIWLPKKKNRSFNEIFEMSRKVLEEGWSKFAEESLTQAKQQEQERIVEELESIDEEQLMSEEDIKMDKEIFGAVENSKHLTSAKWGYKQGINQAIKIIKNNERI